MQVTTVVTQKSQVTLLKIFQDSLNIDPFDKVLINLTNNKKINPVEDILGLAGNLVPKDKKDILRAREAMKDNYQRF